MDERKDEGSVLTEKEVKDIVGWITAQIQMTEICGVHPRKKISWTDAQIWTLRSFVENPKSLMLMGYSENGQLTLHSSDAPRKRIPSGKFAYFVKLKPVTLELSTLSETVNFGYVSSSKLDSLINSMNQVYIPSTTGGSSWPPSSRREYFRALHKFMASLTEAVNLAKGKTVLYVPTEDVTSSRSASRKSDLIQRLESTLIHWTRQIKEVVAVEENQMSATEKDGPLDEIDFWQARTVDLSGISD